MGHRRCGGVSSAVADIATKLPLSGLQHSGGQEYLLSRARCSATGGGSLALWGGGLEIRGSGPVHRMESEGASKQSGEGRQQHALFDPHLGPGQEFGQSYFGHGPVPFAR